MLHSVFAAAWVFYPQLNYIRHNIIALETGVVPLGNMEAVQFHPTTIFPAGILVTEVQYVKRGKAKTFVIVDAAMNDLVRPTLYDAYHEIKPVDERPAGADLEKVDVVGPVCESGDYLARDRNLPVARPGELLAVFSAGAYGAVQSGTYNSRLLVPEVLVDGDRWAVVRPRPSYDDLIGLDHVPDWLI